MNDARKKSVKEFVQFWTGKGYEKSESQKFWIDRCRMFFVCLIGFMSPEIVCSNKMRLMPDVMLFLFGVITSNVHMVWVKSVYGRLKSDYDYSIKIVYNNFLFPNPTPEQQARLERTAQHILDVRTKYSDCSLANLYDELTMSPELRKAHQQNDLAVMNAYGFNRKITESECVAELMKLYQKLI